MPKLTTSQFDELLQSLIAKLEDHGWPLAGRSSIPYGVSISFNRGGMINLYNGKKGPKAVVAGKLLDHEAAELQLLIDQSLGKEASSLPTSSQLFSAPSAGGGSLMGWDHPWIGVDESGKGDYFGPLVAAGCVMNPEGVEACQEAGITDSKALNDREIAELAIWVEDNYPVAVATLMPPEYNQTYALKRNINVILGNLHAQVIRELHAQTGATHALSDRFGPERHVTTHLAELDPPIVFRAQPKAERDTAVAAASIVARAEFVQKIKELSSDATIKLPLGAGSPVLKAGREFVHLFGSKELGKYAKLHFKTTRDIGG